MTSGFSIGDDSHRPPQTRQVNHSSLVVTSLRVVMQTFPYRAGITQKLGINLEGDGHAAADAP